jgi:O-antigen/teichoic acid export membrane protein
LRKKTFFSNIFGIFSTNVFILGLVVISGIILPRLLNPSALGRLYSLIALTAIVSSFTFLGMRSSLLMHLGKRKYEEQLILSALVYIFLLSSVLSTLALLFFFFFLSNDHYTLLIVLLVCLVNPIEFIISYMQGYNLAMSRFGNFNRLNWVPKQVYLLAILLFVGVLGWNIKGAILALIISNLITIMLYLVIYPIKTDGFRKGAIPYKVIKSLVGYGSLYALAFLMTKLNHKIDILILKKMCDIAEVGYYSLAANVAETIWEIPIAIGLVLMTRSANHSDQKVVTGEVCSSLRISLLVVLLVALILYLMAPPLVTILFGERYSDSIPIIRTILPGILFFVILKILNSQFVGTGKPQLTMIALIPGLVINVFLNLLFIPSYKGIGAAMATNLSYFIASLLLLMVYSRTFKIGFLEIFRYRRGDFDYIRKIRLKR